MKHSHMRNRKPNAARYSRIFGSGARLRAGLHHHDRPRGRGTDIWRGCQQGDNEG